MIHKLANVAIITALLVLILYNDKSKTRTSVEFLTGHTGPVNSVAFGEKNVLASGSGDNTIKIWNITNGQVIRNLTGHTDSVNSIAFGKDNVLASGSYDSTIKI